MESGNGALTWVIFHPIFTSLIGMPQIYIHSFIWKGCRIHLQVKTLVRRVRDAGRENENSRRGNTRKGKGKKKNARKNKKRTNGKKVNENRRNGKKNKGEMGGKALLGAAL